jgi:hypothetical protein
MKIIYFEKAEAKEKRRRMKILMSRRRRRSASSGSEQSDQSERSLSQRSSDDEGSEDEIPDYLSGGSSDDETKQMIRDEKDKEAEGEYISLFYLPYNHFRFLVEAAIKIALEEFMEKIKQSGAVFHNNNSNDSQASQFSFTDLSTHLFAAFASHDCPSPLYLDQNSSDDDPYSMSISNYDQPFKSILIGNKQLNVPPGKGKRSMEDLREF